MTLSSYQGRLFGGDAGSEQSREKRKEKNVPSLSGTAVKQSLPAGKNKALKPC